MKQIKTYDAIVLGSGVAGLGVAIHLRMKGLTVLVVSKRPISGEASRAAAGILDPFLQTPNSNHELLDLTIPSFLCFHENAKWIQSESGMDIGYKQTGMIYRFFNSKEKEELRRRFVWQSKSKIKTQWTSEGIEYPTVGRVFPHRYIEALKKTAIKRGVSFCWTHEKFKFNQIADRVVGLDINKSKFSTEIIVNALGSWSSALDFSHTIPEIVPVRGQIAIVQSKNLKIKQILHNLAHHYLVPWDNDLYLFGTTTENVGYRAKVTEKGIESVFQGVGKFVSGPYDFKIQRMWAGLRPKTKDGLPVIGQTRVKGLYMAGGYYRSGILFGFYAGKLLANSIFSGKIVAELSPFNPLRFYDQRKA